MKLRHVRAVAVFGIAVFALTGARGSGGASCGGSSGSSSSSSSSGGSNGDSSSSSGGSDSSSTSTSGSTGGTTTTGGSSSNKAERDIRIDSCKLEGKNLVARLTVTNSGSLDSTYNITMKFRGDATSTATTATARVASLKVKAGASQPAEATTPYTGKGDGSEYKECVVSTVTKS
ncbi:hypothetical protein OG625_03070 [Streptomyces sp. NBC_01351]|uniref:hypothetical protein n=1 Tax=Streptomyces sp. NBC_01351 TaxID=2903833 RepID=UPI002E356789|nr:hypothetical protein [Streptomyces sp. NBC_01351]